MLHERRVWCVAEVETASELAEKLTEHSWTLCTAFRLEDYLFLNDATSEDGAAEFGVLKRSPNGTYVQIESITFSWTTEDKACELIRKALNGEFDEQILARELSLQIEVPEVHKRCAHCA